MCDFWVVPELYHISQKYHLCILLTQLPTGVTSDASASDRSIDSLIEGSHPLKMRYFIPQTYFCIKFNFMKTVNKGFSGLALVALVESGV